MQYFPIRSNQLQGTCLGSISCLFSKHNPNPNIHQSTMSTRLCLVITTLAALLTLIAPHAVQLIQSPEIQVITAYLNQAKSINIPFQKCFKVEPELDANLQYLDFSPTRIGLSTLKSFPIKNEGSHISAFEQLRNPNSFKHRNLLIFDNYLMVFFAPNIIFVLEESRDGFKLKNKYFLENLERYDQFKMYKLENKALLVIFNKNRAYLLNQIDYEDYTFSEISSIVHLQETGKDNEFYAAQSLKGLSHYRLNPTTKKIDLVKRYNGEIVGLKGRFNYIVDINLRLLSVKGIIYALDAEIGLVSIKIANTQQSKVLVSHKNCESFDTIGEEHFVLLCQSQGHSTIIEAYRYVDKKTKQFKYRKIEPIFQANYLNDLHLTEQYYLVYSYKSIHAFWNTEKNRLPETLQTQSQIAVPGLETFTLHNSNGLNFLYTIQAGELKKYELRQQKPKLLLKSFTPADKLFKIYMYGSCNDLMQQPQQANIKACKVLKMISFKAIQQQYPHEQDINISASIVIILITAFLLLIWVCLKKYKGMEREARKILENYQKKRKNQHRAI